MCEMNLGGAATATHSICRYLGEGGMMFKPFLHVFHVVLARDDCRMLVRSREACTLVVYVNLCINYVMYRE